MQNPAALGCLVILLVKVKAEFQETHAPHEQASITEPAQVCASEHLLHWSPPSILNSPFHALCSAPEARHGEITFCSSPKRLWLCHLLFQPPLLQKGGLEKEEVLTTGFPVILG